MANLYPNTIINSKSDAEIKIFNIFKNFSNDFHIIHSLPWLSILTSKKIGRYNPEGEIDFVILHKSYGILCLEIKGGRISYKRHAYFTYNERIRNPYEQVRDNQHHIINFINKKNILIGYSVGFPDSIKPLYCDNQLDITFDINDLDTLEDKIIEIYKYWQIAMPKAKLKQNDINLIIERLLPSSIEELNQKIIYDNKEWLTTSKEQLKIIENGIQKDRFFLKGRAGTGKTILSIIMARILLERNYKILFLTFNKDINKHIQKQFFSQEIDIYTFHKFLSVYTTLSKSVIKDEHLHLKDIIGNISNQYNVLIIDEAQSFSKIWLNLLNEYFQDKKVYIYADSLQSFSHEGKISDKEMDSIFHFESEMTLTKNYRSPRKVYERLLEMFTTSLQQVSPRPIDDLDLIENITDNAKGVLHETINNLLNKGIKKEDIVILVSSKEKNNLELFEYKKIEVKTVQAYRGMEKPIVIYIIKSANKSDLHELYVAYSRSTTQTIVIIPDIVLNFGKSELEKILVESDFTNEKVKNEINMQLIKFQELLYLEYPYQLKIKKISIRYSDKYFLFEYQKYKFINTLIQDYILKKELSFLEVSSYDERQAIVYSSRYNPFSVEFDLCESCQKQTFLRGNFCLKCNENEFNTVNIDKIEYDINMMFYPKKYPKEELATLDDSLKSLGRLFWKFKKNDLKLTDATLNLLNHPDVMCISWIIEILICLVDYKEDVISLKEIRDNEKLRKLNGLSELYNKEDKREWTSKTGVYNARFIDKKLGILHNLKNQ